MVDQLFFTDCIENSSFYADTSLYFWDEDWWMWYPNTHLPDGPDPWWHQNDDWQAKSSLARAQFEKMMAERETGEVPPDPTPSLRIYGTLSDRPSRMRIGEPPDIGPR